MSDKAGNKANLFEMPKINIDMTSPKLTETAAPQEQNSGTSAVWYRFVEENGEASGNSGWKKYNNSILTNKTKVIELAGGFEDKNGDSRQSGISEICVKIGEKQIPAKVYSKNEEGKWEIPADDKTGFEKGTGESGPKCGVWIAKIEAENLTEGDGTKSAVISIKDYAGNVGNTVSASILVDTVAPTVKVEMPTANTTLNGLNTFSGKVNDTNDVKSIALYYYAKGTACPTSLSGFTKMELSYDTDNGVSMSDVSAWKFTGYDVNELLDKENNEEKSEVYILPVAYDKAGNCSIDTSSVKESDCIKITIDLNSDRPVIKFNNLSGSGEDVYVTSDSLNISVDDDDGISKLEYSFDGGTTWTEATVSSGSATIPLGEDGKKSVYFKIVDTAGATFTTTDAKTYYRPYVTYGSSSDKIGNDTAITFTKDTATPVLSAVNFGFASTSEAASTNAKNTSAENNNKLALGTTNIAGGTLRKYVVFEVQATDTASGIGEVTLSVSSNDSPYILSADNGHYYTESIDVSSWSETNTLIFTVKDKAGLSVTNTKQFTVDNKAPVATLISPESTDTQIGIVTLSGTANDEYSTVEDVRYLVLNNDYYTDSSINKTKVQDDIRTAECSRSGSNNTWKFILNGITGADGYTNAKLPSTAEELEKYSKVTHDKDIYTMTVYIYTKDSLGNEALSSHKISYNPYGDRPTAEVTFPTETKDGPANVNGSIRITGAAQDNVSVKEVFVQIDMNGNGYFDAEDKTILESLRDSDKQIYTIINDTAYKTGDAVNADFSAIEKEGNFWGIKANGTNSWNLTINQFAEMQTDNNKIAGKVGQYQIAIRCVAVDNNYKFGNWSDTQFVIIDNNIPTIGKQSKNIKEYDVENNVTATKTYVTDMYVKGKANLEISVEDVNGIKQVMYYTADTEEGLASATGTKYTLPSVETKFTGGTKGYTLEIPLSTDSTTSGSKYVKVVATKNSDTETTAYEKFCVNFDNKPPVINNITLNGVKYDLNGVKYDDSDKKIVNSNGTYFTFGGSVTDEGNSGFDKVLFYYYREGKTQKRIYDVMIDSTNLSTKDAGRVNINDDLSFRKLDKETLYGTEQTVTIDSENKRTFTISEDSHIRAGGVVEINGTWLTIEKIVGTTVTLKSDAPVTGSQKVFFAYAQVIDNTGSEKTNANGDLSTGDDGDGMAESIIKSLNTWTYDATFHSNYIPDGPGKLVVIAFDKAGNVSANSCEASVQNNAPRLTRVMLATDLNGNGTYEYYSDSAEGPINNLSDKATANGTEFGEFAFYSTLNNKGEGSNIATVTLPAGRDPFVAKNNLLVVPEFTGGNGELSYTYQIVDNLANAVIKTISEGKATEKFAEASASKIVNKEGTNVNFDSSQSKEFEITNGVLEKKESWTSTEKLTRYLATTFWDSTEETTPGVDSCYALLKMPLIINVVDDTKPTASIKPFYWNSKEDSSFVYDVDGNPLGHIDIPAENSTENPGVSGEVYIEGEAWDDTRIGGIWMTTPGTNGTNETHQVAEYKGGEWSEVKTGWPKNWMAFEILEDSGIKQSGHTVKWRFHVNMTPYGIKTNQVVSVQANDAASKPNGSDSSSEQTTKDALTPTYKMDFVPYIKSIYAAGVGSANRSRLGKFPVRAGEKMIIEGMNFNGGTGATYSVNFYKSNTEGTGPSSDAGDKTTVTASINDDGNIEVNAPDYSRWVEVVVNNVSTKNNSNTNGGYNIEAGYVARYDTTTGDKGLSQANTAGTNFWTDDRYISVWNNTALKGSINPWDGTVKQIRSRDTKDGSFYKNSSGNSVDLQNNTNDTYYAGWSSPNMMIYSTLGNGAATNVRTLYNNSQASFVTPVETVDIAIIGGLPWYVFNDNYVGGNSANTWGAGLMIAREGYNFPKNTLNGTNTISDSENLNIVERQGSSTAADSRDSSNGYDSVLHQFKNPKITGWYDGISVSMNNGNGNTTYSGTVYVYVSYYDSYARCLKYAAFTEGWSNGEVSEKWGNINGTKNFNTLARTANNHKEPTTVVAGVDRIYNNPTDFSVNNGEDCGEWSDIMVDPTSHVPVIIYYNKTKGTLEIAQGKSNAPSTANYKASAVSFEDTTEGDDGWSKTKSITPKNGIDFGRYVSAEIDSQGNIHASAMDTTNGKLYYIFLKKDGTSYTPTYKMVDSTSAVGMWTDIQLGTYEAETNVWSDYAPVIAYLDKGKLNTTSAAKIAYVESGKWEAISDPAVYEAYDKKTNAMCNVYESTTKGVKAKAAISFNSSMLAVDFLRGED